MWKTYFLFHPITPRHWCYVIQAMQTRFKQSNVFISRSSADSNFAIICRQPINSWLVDTWMEKIFISNPNPKSPFDPEGV